MGVVGWGFLQCDTDVFGLWLAYRYVPMCEQCGHDLHDKVYAG